MGCRSNNGLSPNVHGDDDAEQHRLLQRDFRRSVGGGASANGAIGINGTSWQFWQHRNWRSRQLESAVVQRTFG